MSGTLVMENSIVYCVVADRDDNYSVWPKELCIPSGWDGAGVEGSMYTCLEFIESKAADTVRDLSSIIDRLSLCAAST